MLYVVASQQRHGRPFRVLREPNSEISSSAIIVALLLGGAGVFALLLETSPKERC
jgi:hypothetical protein